MSKINEFVDSIGTDKALHMFFAAVISFAVAVFFGIAAGVSPIVSALLGLLLATGLELFKEYVLDEGPDSGDILFSVLGACAPLAVTGLALLCRWIM